MLRSRRRHQQVRAGGLREDGVEAMKAAILVSESPEAHLAFVQAAAAEPGQSRRSV